MCVCVCRSACGADNSPDAISVVGPASVTTPMWFGPMSIPPARMVLTTTMFGPCLRCVTPSGRKRRAARVHRATTRSAASDGHDLPDGSQALSDWGQTIASRAALTYAVQAGTRSADNVDARNESGRGEGRRCNPCNTGQSMANNASALEAAASLNAR